MDVSGLRRLRRHRTWWPLGLALGGAVLVVLLVALRETDADRGIVGPLLAAGVIAGLPGLLTGVAEGIVQPSAAYRLRIQMMLVVLALVAAATLRSGPLVAGLAALFGSGIALGTRWCGLSVMSALVGRDEDEP